MNRDSQHDTRQNVVGIDSTYAEPDGPPLIPPGEYEMRYVRYKTSLKWGRQPKVDLELEIIGGPLMGKRLFRYYNVRRVNDRGDFKASFHGDLVREFAIVTGYRPNRLDRIPLTKLRPHILLAKVKTVEIDRIQRERPAVLHYSVVAEILGSKPL